MLGWRVRWLVAVGEATQMAPGRNGFHVTWVFPLLEMR